MPKDPFDLTDLSDLPDELQKQLRGSSKSALYLDLMREAKRPVGVAEMRVALYRKTGEVMRQSTVSSLMHMLKKRGDIQSAGNSKWELVK